MKVIKKGRPYAPWSKQFTCTGSGNNSVGCGAVLLVSEEDLYQTSSSSYDGSTDYYTTFCCPCCGAETDVKLPSEVKLLGKQPSESERKRIRSLYSKNKPETRRIQIDER